LPVHLLNLTHVTYWKYVYRSKPLTEDKFT